MSDKELIAVLVLIIASLLEEQDKPFTMHTLREHMLHNAVVNKIEAYHEETGDPPPSMMAVYEYLHEKQIENVAEVRGMLSEYKA